MINSTSDDQSIHLKAMAESFLERPEDSLYLKVRKIIEDIYYQSEESQKNISPGSWNSEEIAIEKRKASKTKVMQELDNFLANPSSNEKANFLLKQLHLFTEKINYQVIQPKPIKF